MKKLYNPPHTHTHTQKERERERGGPTLGSKHAVCHQEMGQ